MFRYLGQTHSHMRCAWITCYQSTAHWDKLRWLCVGLSVGIECLRPSFAIQPTSAAYTSSFNVCALGLQRHFTPTRRAMSSYTCLEQSRLDSERETNRQRQTEKHVQPKKDRESWKGVQMMTHLMFHYGVKSSAKYKDHGTWWRIG